MILESWFTALGFLHRARPLRLKARWMIFLAALVPWLVGLGVAVSVDALAVLGLRPTRLKLNPTTDSHRSTE